MEQWFHYFSFDSEIIVKVLRKGNGQGINSKFIGDITSIYLNGNMTTKNNIIYSTKYQNIVRMKINQNINNTFGMLINCLDIIEIDLSHFDTSDVNDMGYIFKGCVSLISINFSNFDNNAMAFSMHWMFSDCNSLYFLYLSGFDTRKVECIEYMFENCYLLSSI